MAQILLYNHKQEKARKMQQNYINLAGTTGQKPKNSFIKPIIISAIIIASMIIAAIVAVNIVPKMLIDDAQNQGDTINHADYYTTMQKIFTKVCGREIVISTLRDELKDISNEIDIEDYNSYGRIVLAETKEYIQFSSVNEESDSPDTAVDFVYHEPIQNVDMFILQSGEKAFQHFNGSLTNEFETLDEAIMDHQLFQK